MDLSGKIGIVTGGSEGIGRACVEALAKQGATVVVLDISPHAHGAAVALALPVDVSDGAAVEAAFATIKGKFGKLDFAVNNAGIDIETKPSEEWLDAPLNRTLDVNLRGVYHCMRHEIALMRRNGGGSIVNIGSVAAMVGVPTRPVYGASKHALVGLTRTAAVQFGPEKIRTNIVCPGGVRTALLEKVMIDNPVLRDGIINACPMRRLAEVSDVAEAVLWLVSAKSGYVNGAVLPVDGGVTAA